MNSTNTMKEQECKTGHPKGGGQQEGWVNEEGKGR
jgi:hypothetical protein